MVMARALRAEEDAASIVLPVGEVVAAGNVAYGYVHVTTADMHTYMHTYTAGQRRKERRTSRLWTFRAQVRAPPCPPLDHPGSEWVG